MAVSKFRKDQIKSEITAWLEAGGNDVEVETFRQRYPEISRPTFYRWLRMLRPVVGREQALEAMQKAEELRQGDDTAVRNNLAVVPTLQAINPLSGSDVIQIVRDVMKMAQESAEHCLRDGRIRNLGGYDRAARTLLSAVDTLARVHERMMDAQKIEDMTAVIFEEISKEAPDTVMRIIMRLQGFQDKWNYLPKQNREEQHSHVATVAN